MGGIVSYRGHSRGSASREHRPPSVECHGTRHGLAARNYKVATSVSAVIPTLTGVEPIPKATGGHIDQSIYLSIR